MNEGQQRICTEKTRDKYDEVFVQEKLDGANMAVALKDGEILALTRSGFLASESPFLQHPLFAQWVKENEERFRIVLREGQRLCGEWLALAHGTLYDLPHEPFVAFDLIGVEERTIYDDFIERLKGEFVVPRLLHRGGAFSVEEMLAVLEPSGHGARDGAEGAVWRVERYVTARKRKVVDFLAKYVRPGKEDGRYLPSEAHPEREPIWQWQPSAH